MLLNTGCQNKQAEGQKVIRNVQQENPTFSGTWRGETKDGTDLLFEIDEQQQKVYLTSNTMECENSRIYQIKFEEDTLHIITNRKVASYKLVLQSKENKLKGTLTYKGEEQKICFDKISKEINIGCEITSEWKYTYEERQQRIKEYAVYAPDKMNYSFTYQLNNGEQHKDILNSYGIEQAIVGKKDIELMKAALFWECEKLNHTSNNIATQRDLKSLFEDALEKGTNCRGLSLILAEVLRIYGIKAEIVSCCCYSDVSTDAHVIVRAYSEELKQWILLDPTYCLIMQDKDGRYIDLPNLRENISNNVKMIYNPEAGYNDVKMSEESFKEYLSYMAKNSCYYIKQEINADGADYATGNIQVILVSANYEKAQDFSKKYSVIITTDADKFWK